MPKKTKDQDKGGVAEEALRGYFMESGYFAVRGVPVAHEGLEITDVDLWLYHRASALHRHRANVDAKNKSSPKAAERILWALGLRQALGLDEAIVATTSKNPKIRSFGDAHSVRILDGTLMASLIKRFSEKDERISEEAFLDVLAEEGLDKLQGHWTQRVLASRGRLLTALNFSGCNAWLSDAAFFLDAFAAGERKEAALRCAYLSLAYFLIGLDFTLARLAFLPQATRRDQLHTGFAFGEGGKARVEQMLGLLSTARPEVFREIRAEMDGADDPRATILTEFFGRNDVGARAFGAARVFEALAYARSPSAPGAVEVELKGIIGVVLDAHGIPRTAVLGSNGTSAPTN